MKTLRFITLGLFAVLLCFAMASCSGGDGGNSKKENRTFNVGGVEFTMVYVEGGTFMMGSDDEEAWNVEKPVHKVTLSDYWIGQTEVTQELWQAVMGGNPSRFKGGCLPAEEITWYDCQEFVGILNKITGENFSLPTEAQWEYAARGGRYSKGYKYSGGNDVYAVAWFDHNTSKKTRSVGITQPNELGIYDMSGNVSEWCSDWFGNYSSDDVTDPAGPSFGTDRVIRGGCWRTNDTLGCRSTFRYYSASKQEFIGLRLALK